MMPNVLIAEKNSERDYMTEIYTLPTCPICEIMKKKMTVKEIPFVERSFEDLPKEIETDRTPVLAIDDSMHPGYPIFLLTPSEINKWIEEA